MKKKYILSFAIIVFLLLTLHFIILHPIAIFDTDDWASIHHLRLPFPIIGAWNPIKVFPEVSFSLFSYLGAYTLYPLTGNYCFSLSVSNGLFICLMLTIYFTEFLLYIHKKSEQTVLYSVFMSIIFICLHFIITVHFGNNNTFLFYAYDMNCVYHYVLSAIVNASLIMHMIRHSGYNAFKSFTFRHKLIIVAWTYLAIFSNLYTSVILAVYLGTELLFALINTCRAHCFNLKKYIKENKFQLIPILIWFLSIIIELTGGNSDRGETNFPANFPKSLLNFVSWPNRFSILFVLFVLFTVFNWIKNINANKNASLIKYILAFGLDSLYVVVLSSFVDSNYILRMDVMFSVFFWLLLIIMLLLIQAMTVSKKSGLILVSVTIIFIIATLYFSNTFKEINYCNLSYEQCENLVDDIICQFKTAEANGATEIDVYVPEFDTPDNWPFGIYSASHFEKVMYRHHIIKRRIIVKQVIPSIDKTRKYIDTN